MPINNLIYSFAGLTFKFSSPEPIQVTETFLPFINITTDLVYEIDITRVDKFEKKAERLMYQGFEFNDYLDEDGNIFRRFHDAVNHNIPYCDMIQDLINHKIKIEYLEGNDICFSQTENSLFHTGWEKIMMSEGRMILHASCIDTSLGGILFSGVSGIGKSTQSNLWIQYEQAKLINGDRPILSKQDDGWKAYGSPYAGSSGCHINESCKVRCIVLLQQAPTCSIRRLSVNEAFKKVYSNITANPWDRDYMEKALDLVMKLVTEIPIYELACTKEQEAVEILKKELEGGK